MSEMEKLADQATCPTCGGSGSHGVCQDDGSPAECGECGGEGIVTFREAEFIKAVRGGETVADSHSLAACPFCGKPGEIDVGPSRVALDVNRYFPTCPDDGCLGFNSAVSYARRAEAVTAWNTRQHATALEIGRGIDCRDLARLLDIIDGRSTADVADRVLAYTEFRERFAPLDLARAVLASLGIKK